MPRTLTLQLDDEFYRRLTAAAHSEHRSVVSFIESAIRMRVREQASGEISDGGQPKRQSARGRTLERLFELFEGHDAEEEIRRLKEQDEGF